MNSCEMILLTGTAVVIAGILLGWSADRIADATGLGRLWTGWVLLAGATSVPEFVTDTSAVKIHAANLAGGDLFGSSLTNMAILAVLALLFAPGSAIASSGEDSQRAANPGSPDVFNACLAILLTVLGTAFTFFHANIGGIAGVRPESFSLLLLWLLGTRFLYRRQASRSGKQHAATQFFRTQFDEPAAARVLADADLRNRHRDNLSGCADVRP